MDRKTDEELEMWSRFMDLLVGVDCDYSLFLAKVSSQKCA